MGDGELLQAQVERKGLCNQIYHTDCMELLAQIPDNYVSLILTDPPYGISYRNHFARQPHAVLTGDTGIDYERFARESYRILRENSHAYFFTVSLRITLMLIFLPVLTAIPTIMTVWNGQALR